MNNIIYLKAKNIKSLKYNIYNNQIEPYKQTKVNADIYFDNKIIGNLNGKISFEESTANLYLNMKSNSEDFNLNDNFIKCIIKCFLEIYTINNTVKHINLNKNTIDLNDILNNGQVLCYDLESKKDTKTEGLNENELAIIDDNGNVDIITVYNY